MGFDPLGGTVILYSASAFLSLIVGKRVRLNDSVATWLAHQTHQGAPTNFWKDFGLYSGMVRSYSTPGKARVFIWCWETKWSLLCARKGSYYLCRASGPKAHLFWSMPSSALKWSAVVLVLKVSNKNMMLTKGHMRPPARWLEELCYVLCPSCWFLFIAKSSSALEVGKSII